MDLKVLSSLTTENRHNVLIIGTHNGQFHPDDTAACSILCSLHSNKPVHILRTRNSEMLMQCDICVDIGGGKFDHHQPGFNRKRENGIPYASAGLVWEKYGRNLIELILAKYFPGHTCNINSIFQTFDDSVISLLDLEDNGIQAPPHCFGFISSFLPLWFDNDLKDFNKQFHHVLVTTMAVLENKLKETIGKEISKDIILPLWNSLEYFQNGILEIPAQTIFWKEAIIAINASTQTDQIDFVIFPYPAGGWAAQCVPPSLKDIYGQRIRFPAEWAGQTDRLPEISGVKGARRCVTDCFFVTAATKEDIIKLCLLALSVQ